VQFDTPSIRHAADALAATLREHRRTLHRHPEIAFEEHATASYVESVLGELGVKSRRVVGTGLVAVLEGRGQGCVAVRADMDALPVEEAPGRDGYRSETPGMSHACGHDGHVAVLLGLAELLAGADELPGTVVLYFQPAEEGPGGALPMVQAGVLDDPAPQAVLALHVSSRLPTGIVAVRPGPSTGSDDAFDITVHGVGGHAAHPDTAVDPIPIAAEIISALQQVITREIDPVTPVVLTFGSIHGGTRRNVIAASVKLEATLRTANQHNRDLLVARIPEVARSVAATHRATATVTHRAGYPVGVNDPALTEIVADAARAVLGEHRVGPVPTPTLGGEDFYAFGKSGLPVSMFLLGVANVQRGITAPHHSADFDLDEDALPAGVAVFAETLRRLLVT
jgi:amidohydrolase